MYLLDLGLEPYNRALDLQHRLVAARREGRIEDLLILLEHPPVITLGRRGDESNIVASRELLDRLGIEVHRVERGGDVTYHGPGQLVGYPILDLRGHRQDVGWYMHSLEEVLIRALSDFGVEAGRLEGRIGVWIGGKNIAALGVRIEEWITYHGFALNVSPDLSHFDLIIPCGLKEFGVTSMEEVLGERPEMGEVRKRVAQRFSEVFGVEIQEAALEELFGEGKISALVKRGSI
ncbi:MAG: lipoyl(octanoyl) transferase LipB [Anaerolineae bacterium]